MRSLLLVFSAVLLIVAVYALSRNSTNANSTSNDVAAETKLAASKVKASTRVSCAVVAESVTCTARKLPERTAEEKRKVKVIAKEASDEVSGNLKENSEVVKEKGPLVPYCGRRSKQDIVLTDKSSKTSASKSENSTKSRSSSRKSKKSHRATKSEKSTSSRSSSRKSSKRSEKKSDRASPSVRQQSSSPNKRMAPPPVIVPAKKEHKATVIFMHGLGDQGDGWSSVFEHEIRNENIKYICPSSESRPVTLNMGMRMPAWFDLYGLSVDAQEDAPGIQAATQLVHKMINDEIAAGISANNIILGGFSMGGALALYAGLTFDKKLGGIVGLSSFLIQRNKLPGSHTANLETPIFLGHGTDDFLVPVSFGKMTSELIKKFNKHVDFKLYPGMGHSSCPAELSDVRGFIAKNAF